MTKLANRIDALERRSTAASDKWHSLIWDVGQSFEEMIAANDAGSIPPGDNIIIRTIIDPAGDPIRDRDMPLYRAWCEQREIAVAIAKPSA